MSRLQFAEESAQRERTNLGLAHGRIMDVDIASESTALAKYNILVQASASMLAQANQKCKYRSGSARINHNRFNFIK